MSDIKEKTIKKTEWHLVLHRLADGITSAYVFIMLVFFPLYFQEKYYNIDTAKWQFFLFSTFASGTALFLVLILYWIALSRGHGLKNRLQKIKFSGTDWFLFMYAIIVLISTLLSPYKDQVIWGAEGWNMGLITQLCFVMIYCFVSRYWKWDCSAILLYLASAFIVFLIAVLMRFRVDPLQMYKGVDEQGMINFLTTIGQATWYSSYVVLLFPLGLFSFWFCDKKLYRTLAGIFTSVGFMTLVTQNSDSAFAALCILIFVLFWISLESNKRFQRFLEVMMICFFSFKFIGICQMLFPEKALPLGTLSEFCSQSSLTWILLILTSVFYICFLRLTRREKTDVSKWKRIRIPLLVLLLAGIFSLIVYIYLNTTDNLPPNLKSSHNYFLFDEYWGNNRGSSWTIAAKSFWKGSLLRKIFGCGPDGFSLYVQSLFGQELARKWGRSVALTCAHNEWLNTLINLGITGAVTYLGIFFLAVSRFLKKSREHPELTAIALSVLCYMVHNFFCYQQIVCTPIVFILIGAGESICNGNQLPD